jgi:hypothetical protein
VAHQQVATQIPFAGKASQRAASHQDGAQAGQGAFPHLGEAVIQILTGHKVEDGIAQEFEAFIVLEGKLGMFVEIGTVDQGALQQALVSKDDA